MKIYTKTGDKGETSLAMGGRVKKYDSRVSLYGTTDELNSVIGIALAFLNRDSELFSRFSSMQSLLFELGSELAGFSKTDDSGNPQPIILDTDISLLENWMDEWSEMVPPLKNFVLPGGAKSAAFFHQARTVCRRLERSMVEERDKGLFLPDNSIVFINRLSDALFLAARVANREENISEPIWESRAKKS